MRSINHAPVVIDVVNGRGFANVAGIATVHHRDRRPHQRPRSASWRPYCSTMKREPMAAATPRLALKTLGAGSLRLLGRGPSEGASTS